jgi:branched-chain amino acid transport system substrate-binding protein
MKRRQWMARALASAGAGSTWISRAAPSDNDLLIGQTAAFSGPLGAPVKMIFAGTTLAIAEANARGGVGGRQVRLLSLDDQLKAEIGVANCHRLIAEDHVLALFGTVGGRTVQAALPLLQQADLPLIAPYAIPDAVRESARGTAYCVRASFARELEALVQQLTTIGITRIGLAHVSVASEMPATLASVLSAHALQTVAVASIAMNGANLSDAAQTLVKAKPQAVILALDTQPAAALMKAVWADGDQPFFYGTSLVAGEQLWHALDGHTRGLVVAQVMPYPWNGVEPDVRAFQALCKRAGVEPSYHNMEGYIAGRVLVESLRRAGGEPTRASLHRAIRSLSLRVAGMDISFAGGSPTGSRFVELVQVSEQGRFVR